MEDWALAGDSEGLKWDGRRDNVLFSGLDNFEVDHRSAEALKR